MDNLKQQQQALKNIVREGMGSSLFAHLGLIGLKKQKDFDLLHQSFAQTVPVHTPLTLQTMLTQMARQQGDIADILTQKNVTTTAKLAGLCHWKGALIPVSTDTLSAYYSFEKETFSRLAEQGIKPKGHVFTLFEREKGYVHGPSNLSVTGWNRLISEKRPVFGRSRHLPHLDHMRDATGSRFQWFNAMLEVLKTHGEKIETLIANPATLVDFALFAAQQEGRFVPLSDLCPNLKVLLYTGELSPYRMELSYFFRNLADARWVQFYHAPTGQFAYQRDVNIRDQVRLYPTPNVFYEFVPEEDITPSGEFHQNYRRLHIAQVQAKRRYGVLLSNNAGLLGLKTNKLVEIKSIDPLRITLTGNVKRLNNLEEALYEQDVAIAIDGINTALSGQGLFVRTFMLASRSDERQPLWLLEVSRPIESIDEAMLHSIVSRLQNELALKNKHFRALLQNPGTKKIETYFVPMGTMAAFAGDRRLPKFDHSPDAKLLRHVLSNAWTHRKVTFSIPV